MSGSHGGATGPTQGDYVKVLALDVALRPGASWRLETSPDDTVFAYLFEGAGTFGTGTTPVNSHRAVLFGEGRELAIKAGPEGLRFMLFAGKPLREPIAWGGPIVMNTREELRQAFAELDNDTFIRHPR
ncbi:MAG TPA: pirin-like C-terminal cupin domain-containing protein [Candidatus Ozemobacteraceae bacterium]